jgi:hypothetical protein
MHKLIAILKLMKTLVSDLMHLYERTELEKYHRLARESALMLDRCLDLLGTSIDQQMLDELNEDLVPLLNQSEKAFKVAVNVLRLNEYQWHIEKIISIKEILIDEEKVYIQKLFDIS